MTTGAVLCGGASRRMGRDKALVEVDGIPMATRVAAALAGGGCDRVVLVGGDPVALGGLGHAVVADRWPGEGPVGGLVTAMAWADDDDVVVAACDLPRLDDETVRRTIAAGDDTAVGAAVATADGRPGLLSWWRRTTRAALDEAWAAGVRSMSDLYAAPTLHVVTVAVDPAVLHNVNTLGDLRRTRPPSG